MYDCLKAACDLCPGFKVPEYEIDSKRIPLPCIIKSLKACSDSGSHDMQIIESWSDLKIQKPFLTQKFIPHDGIIHKVYVIGSKVFIYKRASVSNTPTGVFSSQDIQSANTEAKSELDSHLVKLFCASITQISVKETNHRNLHSLVWM